MAAQSEQAERLPTLVIVGRPNVGKSSLISRYSNDEFPADAKVVENYTRKIIRHEEKKVISMDLWDTT